MGTALRASSSAAPITSAPPHTGDKACPWRKSLRVKLRRAHKIFRTHKSAHNYFRKPWWYRRGNNNALSVLWAMYRVLFLRFTYKRLISRFILCAMRNFLLRIIWRWQGNMSQDKDIDCLPDCKEGCHSIIRNCVTIICWNKLITN